MKKKILGVLIVLAAVIGAVVCYIDNDPETNADLPATYKEITRGIDTFKQEDPAVVEENNTPVVTE